MLNMMWCPRPSGALGALGLILMTGAGCSNSAEPAGESGQGGMATSESTGGTGIGGGPAAGGRSGSAGTTGTGGAGGSSGSAPSSGGAATGGSVGTGGSSAGGGSGGLGGAATGGGAGADSAGRGGAGASGGAAMGGAGNSSGAGAGGVAGLGGASAGGSAGAAGGASTCPPATPLTGGKQYCANGSGNPSGTIAGGYAYELWMSGGGMGCMTVYSKDATFSATWTNVGDFLARIGLGFDSSKTPAQLGTIGADFAETKTGDTGFVYVGIYGWTVSPLREYYILDDWGSMKPGDTASDGTPRTHVGTISVDGDTYDVWKHTQNGKPAITGDNMTFDQYFSVRQTARQCGHISISEHFTKWMGLGLDLGKLEEAKLLVESQDSTGTIDFTTAAVTVK